MNCVVLKGGEAESTGNKTYLDLNCKWQTLMKQYPTVRENTDSHISNCNLVTLIAPNLWIHVTVCHCLPIFSVQIKNLKNKFINKLNSTQQKNIHFKGYCSVKEFQGHHCQDNVAFKYCD